MAKMPTYRASAGTVVDATTVNTLFSDVATATASIDENNVRAQAVDVAQLEINSGLNAGAITRYVSQDDDAASTSHSSGSIQNVATFTLATPMQIRPGDVWRCYISFRVADQGSSVTNTADLNTMVSRVGSGWIFWLEWDTAGAGTYTSIPGQETFSTTHYAGVNDHAGNPIPHIPTNQTLTSLIFPHVSVTESNVVGSTNAHQYVDTSGLGSALNRPIRRTRSFHYRRPSPGTTVTVYGLRLKVRGVVSFGRDPAGSGQGLMFVRDTAMYATDPTFGGAADSVSVDNKTLVNIVQADQ